MFEGQTINSTNSTTGNGIEDKSTSVLLMAQVIGASVCYIVCLFIVITNTLFLVCFFINRRQEWVGHSKNIISLVLMDWLVGVTAIGALAVSATKRIDVYLCMTVQSLCLSSQVGSHMNVFRLCVIRLVSVKTRLLVKESSKKSIIVQTVFVYVASLTACLLPVFIWGSHETSLERCTWSGIYGDNIDGASTYMFFVTLLPTIATSVLYIILCVDLKRTVAPYIPTDRGLNTVRVDSNSQLESQDNPRSTKVSDTNSSASKGHNADRASMGDMKPSTTALFSTSLNLPTAAKTSRQHLDIPSTSRTSRISHLESRDQQAMTSVMIAHRTRLMTVFKTVGTILICMNISILPYIIALGINVFYEKRVISGSLFFFLSSILLLNSGLDPIIYMIRIKHLNVAFKRMIRRQCCA